MVGEQERKLWLNTILRAQAEAAGDYRLEGMKVSVSPIHRFQAQRWLTNPKFEIDQFLLVCELAGLSKDDYIKLRTAERMKYGVVGGQGWQIAKRQEKEK